VPGFTVLRKAVLPFQRIATSRRKRQNKEPHMPWLANTFGSSCLTWSCLCKHLLNRSHHRPIAVGKRAAQYSVHRHMGASMCPALSYRYAQRVVPTAIGR